MIFLTKDYSLKMCLGEAAVTELDIVTRYRRHRSANREGNVSWAASPDVSVVRTNDTSDVTLLAAPAANDRVDYIAYPVICNRDTIAHTMDIWVEHTNGTRHYLLDRDGFSLAAGRTLCFTEEGEPKIFPESPGVLTVPEGGTGGVSFTDGAFIIGNAANGFQTVGPGTAGQIPVSQGAGADPIMRTLSGDATLDSAGALTIAAGAVEAAMLEVNERWLQNYCINDFGIAQRTTPTTLTNISTQSYGPDRWKVIRDVDFVQFRRYARGDAGSDFTGLNCEAYARFQKTTSASKFQFYQIVEKKDSSRFRGNPVTFRIKLRSDASRTIRIGLIEWTGTADAPTAAMISPWNSNGVDPTLVASYSRVASASCSVTTTFQEFTVTGTPSSTCNNLLFAVWSDSSIADTSYIEVAEPYLALGSLPRIWTPRPIQQELALCQRYCWVPTQTGGNAPGIGLGQVVSLTFGASTGSLYVHTPVSMRQRPTLTATPAQWILSDGVTTPAASAISLNNISTPEILRLDVVANGTFADIGETFQLVADGTGSRVMIFDAEL